MQRSKKRKMDRELHHLQMEQRRLSREKNRRVENQMNDKPWWNDSDKVAGLITTILFLAGVIIACVVAVGFALRWAF